MVKISKLVLVPSAIGTVAGVTFLFKDYLGGQRVTDDTKLYGRTVIVTGANSGIGKEVAHDLANRGARVIMACRNIHKCLEASKAITEDTCNMNVHCKKLDLSSLQSVRDFAEDINKNETRLDILVNNAGVMAIDPKEVTAEGFEMQLGVNYLGPFLLTNLLLDKLKKSAPSRIVNTASLTYRRGSINFKDLNSDSTYKWKEAYEQSKMANVLFTSELHKRLQGTNVSSFCALPVITKTNIDRHMGVSKSTISSTILFPFYWMILKSPVQGAQTSIYCAVQQSIESDSGKCFSNCKAMAEKTETPECSDSDIAKRLWIVSETWTRLQQS